MGWGYLPLAGQNTGIQDAHNLAVTLALAKDFVRMYAVDESAQYIVRPDGYVAFTSSRIDTDDLVAHLSSTFGVSVSTTAMPDLR